MLIADLLQVSVVVFSQETPPMHTHTRKWREEKARKKGENQCLSQKREECIHKIPLKKDVYGFKTSPLI